MMFELKIPGNPVSQPRARAASFNGKARMYQPKTAADNKAMVMSLAKIAIENESRSDLPFTGPVAVRIVACYPCPKSQERKRKPRQAKWKSNGSDIDNIAKHYMDALCASGVLTLDDRQISSLQVLKIQLEQGEAPYTLFEISPLGESDEA